MVWKSLDCSRRLTQPAVDQTIQNEDTVLLQEALEPHYIHEIGGERLATGLTTTIGNRHSVDTSERASM
jgi:hypothetical protein